MPGTLPGPDSLLSLSCLWHLSAKLSLCRTPLALSLGFGKEGMHEVLWKIWKTTHLPQSPLPMCLGRLFKTLNMYGALRRRSCGKHIGNKQQPNLIYDVLIYVVPGLDVNEDLKQYSLSLSLIWLPKIFHIHQEN